jgi:hypothetical protein
MLIYKSFCFNKEKENEKGNPSASPFAGIANSVYQIHPKEEREEYPNNIYSTHNNTIITNPVVTREATFSSTSSEENGGQILKPVITRASANNTMKDASMRAAAAILKSQMLNNKNFNPQPDANVKRKPAILKAHGQHFPYSQHTQYQQEENIKINKAKMNDKYVPSHASQIVAQKVLKRRNSETVTGRI